MTPLRRAQVVCVESLAAGVPVVVQGFAEVSWHLHAGKLERALSALSLSPDFARVVSRWPRAASVAWRRIEALPSRLTLVMSLMQTALYGGLVFLVEWAVWSVLDAKVFRTFPNLGWPFELGSSLVVLSSWLFAALGLLGVALLFEVRWLSPWLRYSELARGASLLESLRETRAPDDVRAECARLLPPLPLDANAQSLDALAAEYSARAAVSMERSAAVLRGAMYVMLVTGALGLSIAAYGTLPTVSQVVP